MVEALTRSYDTVVLDTSGMLNELAELALEIGTIVLWVTTTEFATMADWAASVENEIWQDVIADLRTMATDITTEIWGPSPVVPQPIRPGG